MTKLRNLSLRHTIIFCIVFMVACELLYYGFGSLTSLMPQSPLFTLIKEIIHISWPVLLAFVLGYGFCAKTEGFVRTLKAGWAYLVLYAFSALFKWLQLSFTPDIQWQSFAVIMLGILKMLGIGIREEFLYRGVLVNVLTLKYEKNSKGIWLTVITSSLLFSFSHMTNAFYGLPVFDAFIQSLGAIGVSLVFAAIYLRGGNIWFLVVLHGIIDLATLMSSGFTVTNESDIQVISKLNVLGPIALISVGIAVSLFLLRKSKHQEMLDRFSALRSELGC